MTERTKAFFINGGAGRVLCSIPALEKYAEEVDKNFIVVCEGGTDFYRGHPILHSRCYDHWHKNLFEDKLINCDLITPEPYRVWEYFNQKCSIAQAYDIAINNKGIRELQQPFLKLSNDESILGFNIVKEVKEKTGKKKVVVFQPFGRGVKADNNIIYDPSGRSFEGVHVIEIVKKLQKEDLGVIVMSELGIDFQKHGCKDPVALPQNVSLRQWAGIIGQADYFLGCDSVGQHLAVALNKPLSVVLGSTFPINVTYMDYDKLDILDMGGEIRQYSPIRITMDDVADRGNDGIMKMNEKVENAIVESVKKGIENFPILQSTTEEISVTSAPTCPTC